MVSGDAVRTEVDTDNVWYIQKWLDTFRFRFFFDQDIVPVFFTGGYTSDTTFMDMHRFNEIFLGGKGKNAFEMSSAIDFQAQGLDRKNPVLRGENLYWRSIYRLSKALALYARGGTAYVHMKPYNCRNIFSDYSQKPKDNDPDHMGKATVGEVWYFAELPTLMRNLHITQIVAFYKKDGTQGDKREDFGYEVQWDANAVTRFQ